VHCGGLVVRPAGSTACQGDYGGASYAYATLMVSLCCFQHAGMLVHALACIAQYMEQTV